MTILSKVENFNEEIAREDYVHLIGKKKVLNTKRVYKKYSGLFSEHNVSAAYDAWKQSSGIWEERQNRNLYAFLVFGHIGNKLRSQCDKLNNEEAKATVKVNGKKVAYRSIPSLIMNEQDRNQRRKLFKACSPVRRKLTVLEKAIIAKEYVLLKKLTGKDYVSFYEWYKQVGYDSFAKHLQSFLAETGRTYEREMRKLLSTINVPLEKAEQHDLSFIMRAKKYDAYFPKKQLIPMLKRFLHGIGYDIAAQKSIAIDAEERPRKVPRAFCYPIIVPQEVKLVLKPHGGQGDYQAILHEAGHTEHYANTDEAVPYELRHMGPHSVSETYAFLFEYLMTDNLWLQKYARMPPKVAKDFSRFLMLEKLFFFRRYAGKVLYELKLHRKDLRKLDARFKPASKRYPSLRTMYADILGNATRIKYASENYLLDLDGGFYSVDYARAWMMECILRNQLSRRIGKRWWEKKHTGRFLKSFWKYGSSGITIEEISSRLGQDFGLKPLSQEFQRFFHPK